MTPSQKIMSPPRNHIETISEGQPGSISPKNSRSMTNPRAASTARALMNVPR